MIDITMTAVVRPELLRQTLTSFCKFLFVPKYHYRLILNVDPIGEPKKPKEVYKIASNFFDNIVVNYPKTPGFSKAVIWCWSQVISDYVFHLEDDWRLLQPLDLKSMVRLLDENQNLASLRLNKNRIKRRTVDNFVYCSLLSLNPSLLKGKFVKDVSKLMVDTFNPEKQLRPHTFTPERAKYISSWKYGIYTKETNNQVVLDIGRSWMKKSPYKKKTGFLEWKKK